MKIENKDFDAEKYPEIECYAFASNIVSADMTAQIKKSDKLALIYGDGAATVCKKVSADGVIVDLSASEHIKKDFTAVQKEAGADKLFGIVCRSRRHEAMIASECEPNFVIFKVWEELSDKQRELFDWYQEFFLLQSAAEMCGEKPCQEKINTDILLVDEEKYKILVAMKKILE